jgi:hypothetical protein
MSEINYFKKFVLYKIMCHDVVVIYQLLGDIVVDNWWMMLISSISRELY